MSFPVSDGSANLSRCSQSPSGFEILLDPIHGLGLGTQLPVEAVRAGERRDEPAPKVGRAHRHAPHKQEHAALRTARAGPNIRRPGAGDQRSTQSQSQHRWQHQTADFTARRGALWRIHLARARFLRGLVRIHNAGVAGTSPAPVIREASSLWTCGAFFVWCLKCRVLVGNIVRRSVRAPSYHAPKMLSLATIDRLKHQVQTRSCQARPGVTSRPSP